MIGNSADKPRTDNGQNDPFASLRLHILELKEYASYLSGLKSAQLRYRIKKIALAAAMGAGCALLLAVTGAVAVILTLQGLVDLLAWATGWQWLGELVVGVGVLALMMIGAAAGFSRIRASSRRNTIGDFEARQEKQRVRFNRDVEQAAREQIARAVSQRTNQDHAARVAADGPGYQG